MPFSNAKRISAGYQPIDGYTLEEVVGRGGFGEVWRANAPGGIKKAVKFVFGDHAEHRAERELKSLERIKGVQHPFLLTLERFEIVDGQLVIVTELADGSLEDIFNQHRERGSCGIPRNMLLGYMHDAADALDYLHEMYQLQHLDIKPANLLMVGGRVKVADFGLLKDLRDADCSIIGGLTPIYAPPEVFDGKPSMNSDQYSLAVMYQELLTGVRPFSGRTIAQLATQHVHNAPNLESLPSCDQPVIARALEKNPDRRYASCREFVEGLREPHQRSSASISLRTTIGAVNLAMEGEPKEVQDLPGLDDATSAVASSPNARLTGTPILVVALGGSGARCVAQLHRQFSSAADTPISLHTITIDTDISSLTSIGLAGNAKRDSWARTLHTPLRSAQEYRTRGTDHLRTVSRRWIYNIPRSGQTEGMRPLGRMALVDHGKEVLQSVREAVEATINSAPTTKPLVFVVGSTSGGTSSGMYIDVVHVLRHCLDTTGQEGTRIVSLLLAPAMRNDPRRPLILHDTTAMLTEISHLIQPGNSYPGDEGAGWKSIPAARTPLRDTYVIAASTEPGMPNPIQAACDYIHLSGIGASDLLESARRGLSEQDSTSHVNSAVRSVGVIRLAGARTREHRVLAATAARQLFLSWLGNPIEARSSASAFADRLKRRARLGLHEFADPIIRSFGEDRNARRAKLMIHLRSLSVDELRDDDKCRKNLCAFIERNTVYRDSNSMLHEAAESLQRELAARLHDREGDLSTAIEAVRVLASGLLAQTKNAQTTVSRRVSVCESVEITARTSDVTNAMSTAATLQDDAVDVSLIGELRSATGMGEEILTVYAHHHAAGQLNDLCDMLGRLEERLCDGAAKVAQSIRTSEQAGSSRVDPWQALPMARREEMQDVIAETHGRLASRWLVHLLSDTAASIDPVEMSNRMIGEIESILGDNASDEIESATSPASRRSKSTYATAKSAISQSKSNTELLGSATKFCDSLALTSSLSELGHEDNEAIIIRPATVEDAIRAVRPPLLDCGGQQRLILFVGSESDKSQYESSTRQAYAGELTVVVVPNCIPTLVHEAQQIKINDVLERLTSLTTGQEEISRRLQSRCDMNW